MNERKLVVMQGGVETALPFWDETIPGNVSPRQVQRSEVIVVFVLLGYLLSFDPTGWDSIVVILCKFYAYEAGKSTSHKQIAAQPLRIHQQKLVALLSFIRSSQNFIGYGKIKKSWFI